MSLWVPALIWGFTCKTATFGSELQVSMDPSHHLWFCAFKTATELLVSMDSNPQLGILHAKQRLLDQNYKSLRVPALTCGFCMQNSDFRTRITRLYGSQPSSVVLCIQNSAFSTRIASLYGSQISPMVFCIQNGDFSTRIAGLYGSQPSSEVFAFKTATFGTELQVSMGPSPHLWILHAKQRLLDQNYKYLWVPSLICGFCMQNSEFRTRITSLYGSQTSPMVLCTQNGDISTRIESLYGSQPSSGFCAFTTATLWPELMVSMGPRPDLSFCSSKTAWLAPEKLVSMGPRPHQSFCAYKTTWLASE